MFDVLVYALLRKYIKDSLVGAGALKGASCQIQSIVRNETDDANIVTYKWEDNNGVSHTSQMIVHDGAIGPKGDKGDKGNKGDKGDKGDKGKGIVNIEQLDDTNQIVVHYDDGTDEGPITVPTLKGDTPTVDVGTVKTVEYNKPAKVTPKVTATGVELDFEIPQGEPGEGGGEATNIFVGTMDEWNALTVSEKEQYTVVNITDDEQYVFTSKFLEKTTTMPVPSADYLNQHRLYVGDTTAQYIKGAIYECQVVAGTEPAQYKWTPISSADVDIATPLKAGVVKPDDKTIKIDEYGTIRAVGGSEFIGTMEEWEALSAAEKATYTIVNITGDEDDLNLGRFLKKLSVMPEAGTLPSEIVMYTGSDTSTFKRGYIYRSTPSVQSGEIVYNWAYVPTAPTNDNYNNLTNHPQIEGVELTGNKLLNDLGIQGQIQFNALPTATSANAGKIVQYIGTTGAGLKTGYFYQSAYNMQTTGYYWRELDTSDNAAITSRIATLETNQGDMAQLVISGVNDVVSALNALAGRSVQAITYTEPNLVISYTDGSTFTFNVSTILNNTQIGELANVTDTSIADGNVLAYDSSIVGYKPYDIVLALTNTLKASKDYTDEQIGSLSQDDAYICDAKPNCSYDSGTGKYTVVYYQNGSVKTTGDINARFYYEVDNDPYCTSWFITGDTTVDPVEFTYLLSTPDFDDFVNKNSDIVATYTADMADKTKVPTVAALDALMAIVNTALGFKINTTSIVDNLESQDATKVLSAKQGKALADMIDAKSDKIQFATMPSASAALEGKVIQYVGASSAAYTKGYFYECVNDDNNYIWVARTSKIDIDTALDTTSGNPVANNVLAVEFEKRGLQVTELPVATAEWLGRVIQYVGGTTSTLKHGYFYTCVTDGEATPTYSWIASPTMDVVGSADGISYDNTSSKLQSIDVQGAIDEVVNNLNGAVQSITDSLGTAAAKDSTDKVRPGSRALVESNAVFSAIGSAITSIYVPHGSITCAELVPSLLTAEHVGHLYNVTDNGITTEYFMQGVGETITAGDTVGIIDAGPNSILFNLMPGVTDLSGVTHTFNGTLDEWEALTEGEQAKYDFIASPDGENITGSYSTTETKTGATWIDGKPIYRRVFTGLSYGSTSGDYRDVGVTIPSIEMLVDSTTIRSRSGAIDHLEDISIIATSNGTLQCLSRGAYSPAANILIVEYTKTTD